MDAKQGFTVNSKWSIKLNSKRMLELWYGDEFIADEFPDKDIEKITSNNLSDIKDILIKSVVNDVNKLTGVGICSASMAG